MREIQPSRPWPRPGPLDHRRRMSLERLALCHRAVMLRGAEGEAARDEITIEEVEALRFGGTFALTLALNRPFLDLYEEKAHVVRVQ